MTSVGMAGLLVGVNAGRLGPLRDRCGSHKRDHVTAWLTLGLFTKASRLEAC